MFVKFYSPHDVIEVDQNATVIDAKTKEKIKVTDGTIPTETRYILVNNKPQMNFVIEHKYITVNHAYSYMKQEHAYWGSFSSDFVRFHFFTNSKHKIIGRIDQVADTQDRFELSHDMKHVSGPVSAILIEDESSKTFTFTRRTQEYKVIVKDGKLKIGTMQFNGYIVNDPLQYFKNTTSEEMINCYVDADGVCDYSFDFGMRYTQGIKSRNDYAKLFRRRYDLVSIRFTEALPSAATMFKCFENCFNLKDIDISTIQGSATVFTRCFANCKLLESLKMNKNKNACRIGGMFSGCISLKNIEFPFEELSAAKKWRYDTEKIESIKAPLMNGFMEFMLGVGK